VNDLRTIGWSEVKERVTGNRARVHEALLKHGPKTCTELAALIGWDKCSIRPRMTELRQAFHVEPTGVRRDQEHEFRALTVAEAEEAHARARAMAEWSHAEVSP